MKQFAIIENGVVINIVVWDGTTKFDLKPGQISVDITGIKNVGIGSTYDGRDFTPPPQVEQVKTDTDLMNDRISSLEVRVKTLEGK